MKSCHLLLSMLLLRLCSPLAADPATPPSASPSAGPATPPDISPEHRPAASVVEGEKVTLHLEGVPESHRQQIEEVLKEQLGFAPDSAPSAPLADDLAFFARQHLISHGWQEADVSWALENGGIRLTFAPGDPLLAGDVTWSGDASPVPAEELEALLFRPLQEVHGKDRAKLPWVNDSVQSGVALVARRLQADGYLTATAALTTAPSADGKRIDLAIELKTGPRSLITTATVTGAPEPLAAQLAAEVSGLSGAPSNQARMDDAARRMGSHLSRAGWLDAQVKSEAIPDKTGQNAALTFRIDPGAQTRITGVEVAPGLSKGAQKTLREVFRPAVGRVWAAADVELLFRRALDSGMFRKLDYEPKKQPAATAPGVAGDGTVSAVLHLDGEETDPYQLGLNGGYETFLGSFVGAEIGGSNLWNAGNRWRIAADYGAFGPSGSISLIDPSLFASEYGSTTELALRHSLRFDYVSTTLGGRFALNRRVNIPFSYTLFTGATITSATSLLLTPLELGPDFYGTLSLGGSMQLDFRDSPVLPTRGWLLEARVEGIKLVGEESGITFTRSELRGSWFQPLAEKTRFAAGVKFVNIAGASTTELPIDLRVFNGGAFSVRSFAERELGPLSLLGDTPVGGAGSFTASAEVSHEVMKNFDIAVFADAGSLSHKGTFELPEDFRFALGAGLRYRLPFGPMRLDYGWNPDRRTGEKAGALHVALGFPF